MATWVSCRYHNSRYLTRPRLFAVLFPSKKKDFTPFQYCLEVLRREMEAGARPCLASPVLPRPPHLYPQAGDRLWSCGRADYRPVPVGVGVILPLPLLFLSAGSEVARGGKAWEAGLICAKQSPKLDHS